MKRETKQKGLYKKKGQVLCKPLLNHNNSLTLPETLLMWLLCCPLIHRKCKLVSWCVDYYRPTHNCHFTALPNCSCAVGSADGN